MIVISHRGNLSGPNHRTENTLTQIESALLSGFGIETDIRRNESGILYISHDKDSNCEGNLANWHAQLWSRYPACEIALNVKELGYEHELIDFIRVHELLEQCFLFDFELLEQTAGSTAALIRELDRRIRLAIRVSDRYGESIERAETAEFANVVWLDEFDSLWVTEEIVARLKHHGRVIYAISPEIHGFSIQDAESRWRQFQAWEVDGICTDFPLRAAAVLKQLCVDAAL